MPNKQPYYHRAVVLFTATQSITREELEKTLSKQFKHPALVKTTVEVEEVEAEPGDPADLCE